MMLAGMYRSYRSVVDFLGVGWGVVDAIERVNGYVGKCRRMIVVRLAWTYSGEKCRIGLWVEEGGGGGVFTGAC